MSRFPVHVSSTISLFENLSSDKDFAETCLDCFLKHFNYVGSKVKNGGFWVYTSASPTHHKNVYVYVGRW